MLYDFQKDAALAIINKLETYNGCILADSFGLGKTFTALALIEYFERRNRNVLVLCPQKLHDNWMTYRSNSTNNPISADHLRYDVLFHANLGRQHGPSNASIDLAQLNWSNYDLVVIDESHGFRNGGDSSSKASGDMNRYERLMNRVIRGGVPTKVLMLTATPVNNRFRDLQNQLRLAHEGNDDDWQSKLGLSTDIDTVFRSAQQAYSNWAKLPLRSASRRASSKSLTSISSRCSIKWQLHTAASTSATLMTSMQSAASPSAWHRLRSAHA